MTNDYRTLSLKNQERAWEIIQEMRVIEIWESIGATINLVGSVRLGLVGKHRDIDFHIYSQPLTLSDSFAAMAQFAEHPAVKHIAYTNLLKTEEECIEWHAQVADRAGEIWQMDLIHMPKGSTYDGYFERVADRITEVLTDEMRRTILQLKFETPDNTKIMGIEYYQAVIEGGVQSLEELNAWRKANPVNGILEWMP